MEGNSAGKGLKATLPVSQRKKGRGASPQGQPLARALPHCRAEQKQQRTLGCCPSARRKQVHWDGFLQLQKGQGFLRQTDRPAGGLPSLRTLKASLQGTLPSASIISHGPESVTVKVLMAWVCRAGWGVGQSRKQPAHRVKSSLGHHPALPTHTSTTVPVWEPGQGNSLGMERYKRYGPISGSCYTSTLGAHTLPTADSIENLTLSGWGSRGEGRVAWEAAMSLLTCFFKELTSLE